MSRPPIPRSSPMSRGARTMTGRALMNDLGAGATRTTEGETVNNITYVTGLASGDFQVVTEDLFTTLTLQAQNASSTEEMSKNRAWVFLPLMEDFILSVMEGNVTGQTYTLEYWDGASWVSADATADVTTTGAGNLPDVGATGTIPVGMTGGGGVAVRVRGSDEAGDPATDPTTIVVSFRRTIEYLQFAP